MGEGVSIGFRFLARSRGFATGVPLGTIAETGIRVSIHLVSSEGDGWAGITWQFMMC